MRKTTRRREKEEAGGEKVGQVMRKVTLATGDVKRRQGREWRMGTR